MAQSMTPQPRTPDQVMAFVSKASEQQLKAMVDAHDPYSFMALAQLQEIRDGKLKAQANQQKPPPLAQTIPQAVEQRSQQEAQSQLDSLSGIASLGQQPAQQPVQQAAQGGLIHLAHGGPVQHYQLAGAIGLSDEDRQVISGLPPAEAQAYATSKLNLLRSNQFKTLSRNGNGLPIDPLTEQPTDYTSWMAPFATQAAAPSASPRPAAQTASAASPATPTPPTANAPQAGIPLADTSRARPPAAAPQPELAQANGLPVGFGINAFQQGLGNIANLQKDAKIGQENYVKDLEKAYNDIAFNPNEYQKAVGDSSKDTEDFFKNRSEKFGDPYESYRGHNKKLLEETEKMEHNSKPKAMLQAAFSMLSDTSGNFFTAIGKAGGAGLAAYEKSQAYVQQEKRKNLEANARLAQAQDLRNRGLYKDAEEEAKQAKADRMSEYTARVNGNIQKTEAAIRVSAAKSQISQQQVDNAVVDFKNRAAVAQVFHHQPNQAIELALFYQKHPEIKREAQDAETVLRAGDAMLKINKQWEDLVDSYSKAGQKLPDETTWKENQLQAWHAALRNAREIVDKSKKPVAVMPDARQ